MKRWSPSEFIRHHPRLAARFGIIYFAVVVLIAIYVHSAISTASSFELPTLRIRLLWIVGVGYLIWLCLLIIGSFCLPKNVEDFRAHLESDKAVRRSFEAGLSRLNAGDVRTDVEYEAIEVMFLYFIRFRYFFPSMMLSSIANVASIILLGATCTYIMVNTAAWPPGEIARLSGWVCSIDPKYHAALGQLSVYDSLRSEFDACGIVVGQIATIQRSDKLDAWVMNAGGTSGVYIIKAGRRLEVYKPESFLTHVYFSAVTTFTIGFGDMHPLSESSRLITILQCLAILVAITLGLALTISFEMNRFENVRQSIIAYFRLASALHEREEG